MKFLNHRGDQRNFRKKKFFFFLVFFLIFNFLLIMLDTQTILGLLIMEKNGRRVLGQYNPNSPLLKTTASQKTFESTTIENIKKLDFFENSKNSKISLISQNSKNLYIKSYDDFFVILISNENENKIFLKNLIEKILECIEFFCGKNLDLNLIFQYYTEILLLFDEILNEGVVVTMNTEEIVAKVLMQEHWKGQKRTGFFY